MEHSDAVLIQEIDDFRERADVELYDPTRPKMDEASRRPNPFTTTSGEVKPPPQYRQGILVDDAANIATCQQSQTLDSLRVMGPLPSPPIPVEIEPGIVVDELYFIVHVSTYTCV